MGKQGDEGGIGLGARVEPGFLREEVEEGEGSVGVERGVVGEEGGEVGRGYGGDYGFE